MQNHMSMIFMPFRLISAPERSYVYGLHAFPAEQRSSMFLSGPNSSTFLSVHRGSLAFLGCLAVPRVPYGCAGCQLCCRMSACRQISYYKDAPCSFQVPSCVKICAYSLAFLGSQGVASDKVSIFVRGEERQLYIEAISLHGMAGATTPRLNESILRLCTS